MLDLVYQNLTKDEELQKGFFISILEIVVGELELKDKNIEVSISLVDEGKIRELNNKYRHKDEVTDVLSFPMQSFRLHRPERAKRFEEPFDHAQGPRSNAKAFDLGDIFICLPFAKKEAKSENVSIDKKLAQLAVHGFLHLLGHDHEKSEEAEKMFGLEKKILEKIN